MTKAIDVLAGCGTALACASLPNGGDWAFIVGTAIAGATLALSELPDESPTKLYVRTFFGGVFLSLTSAWLIAALIEWKTGINIRILLAFTSGAIAWKGYKPVGAVLEAMFTEVPRAALEWIKRKFS